MYDCVYIHTAVHIYTHTPTHVMIANKTYADLAHTKHSSLMFCLEYPSHSQSGHGYLLWWVLMSLFYSQGDHLELS